MQIKHSTTYNCISFRARFMYPLKLKETRPDTSCKFISAAFSELSPDSQTDRKILDELFRIWKEKAKLMEQIRNDFLNMKQIKRFFITERIDINAPSEKRILGIMEIDNPEQYSQDTLILWYLQSFSNLLRNTHIKGVGDLSIYGATKIAEMHNKTSIMIPSVNDSFYEKFPEAIKYTSFPKSNTSLFEIENTEYANLQKRLKEKYSLND